MEEICTEIKWSNAQKILFLFFGTYIFLYIFPFPFSWFPMVDWDIPWYSESINELVTLTAKILFSVDCHNAGLYGSADGVFHYIKIFTFFLISLLFTFSLFTFWRNRLNFEKLLGFLVIYSRYYVGFSLIGYGMIKLFDIQFPAVSLEGLEERYGDSSMQQLMWTFMSASKPLAFFVGSMQILGGYFLFFRRTQTIGALIIIIVMTNVVVMNLCYNIPVKLHSINLLFLTFFISGPDLIRLYKLLILHHAIVLPLKTLVLKKGYQRKMRIFMKMTLIIGLPSFMIIEGVHYEKENFAADEEFLDGVYTTQLFIWENDTISSDPAKNSMLRWDKFIIEYGHATIVKDRNLERVYEIKLDTTLKLLNFRIESDSTSIGKFKYKNAGQNFILDGEWKGSKMYARFRRKTKEDYHLMKPDFKWIQ